MNKLIVISMLASLLGFGAGFFIPRVVEPIALVKHDRVKVTIKDNMFKNCSLKAVVAFEDGRKENRYLCGASPVFVVMTPVSYYSELAITSDFKEGNLK